MYESQAGYLQPDQLKLVNDYSLQAFPTHQVLGDFLRQSMGIYLYSITESGSLQTDVARVVQTLNQRGMSLTLVNALRSANPDDPQLTALLDELELSPARAAGLPTREMLADPALDAQAWRTRLGRLETQVCQVELHRRDGRTDSGTGLLVGPAHILTSYELLEPLISGKVNPGDGLVRFDFKRAPDGSILSPGVEFNLAPDWQVAASPVQPAEDPASESLASCWCACRVRLD